MLHWPGGTSACSIGRAGVVHDKREGDGGTPVGVFALRRVLWRADRLPVAPPGRLPRAPIAADDGWCDAPSDPLYNRPVKLPYPASAESLMREHARIAHRNLNEALVSRHGLAGLRGAGLIRRGGRSI